ncbi:hypothetical protein HK13_09570 [Acetobacter indonesiensis]|nr:hypothetical protein HK13_09570 [Acetobacter indonesiensis]
MLGLHARQSAVFLDSQMALAAHPGLMVLSPCGKDAKGNRVSLRHGRRQGPDCPRNCKRNVLHVGYGQATGSTSWEGQCRVRYRKSGNLPSAGVADGKC